MSNKTVVLLLGLLILLSIFMYAQRRIEANKPPEKSLVSSMYDAYKSGMSIQCDHAEANGSVQIYIRDGGLRFDNTLPSYKGIIRHYINKDDVTHAWRHDKGAIFRDISKNNYGEVSPLFMTTDQALELLEPYKDSCSIARFEDDIFLIPSDIEFTDVRTNAEAEALPKEL